MQRVAETIWAIEGGMIQVYQGCYSDYIDMYNSNIKEQNQTHQLELELKRARLIGELALADRILDEHKYLSLEQEYLETIRQLQRM